MDIQQLRYAVAVAQHLHFQRAAQRVNVTQPTLSQQIKKLEEELGAPLFERSSRKVRLTPAGTRFIPRAVAILEALNASVQELQEEAHKTAGKVRLGVIPTICPYLVPEVVLALRNAAPQVMLEIYEETTSVLVEHLQHGQLDLGVLALPISQRGISSLSIFREPFYLAVSRKHPLAGKRRVAPKDIARERILILQEGHCFREQSLEYCKLSAAAPNVVFQGSSLTSVLRLAASGEGVTFVPRMAVDRALSGGLRYVPFRKPEPTRELGIIWRVTSLLTPAQQAVMEVVERLIKAGSKGKR